MAVKLNDVRSITAEIVEEILAGVIDEITFMMAPPYGLPLTAEQLAINDEPQRATFDEFYFSITPAVPSRFKKDEEVPFSALIWRWEIGMDVMDDPFAGGVLGGPSGYDPVAIGDINEVWRDIVCNVELRRRNEHLAKGAN